MEAGDEVDAGGDHGRRVNERRDRRRALHRVWQPGVQRELRALGECPDRQQRADAGDQRASRWERLGARKDIRQAQGVGVEHDQEGRDHERDVTDHLGDERLASRQHGGRPVVPEPDEQIAAQGDERPPDDEDHQVRREHEHQHREDEEVHVAEEAGEPGVVLHVADAVDVDQEADAGDDHEHQRAQRIEREVHADREIGAAAEVDPVPETHADGAVPRRCADDAGEHETRDHEGREDGDGPGDVDEAPAEHRTEEPVERCADQREEQHQDDQRRRGADVHSFISLRSSTSSSRPSRKIWVISASPTTTSAAATTITMKAKI